MGVDTGGISCCFDERSQRVLEDYRKSGLDETARTISDTLARRGLKGSSVLELGCGFGALALDLVRRGASSAVGIDLSPKMIHLAGTLAAEEGLSDLVSFQVGDGAVIRPSPSDIVVLDKVLCCYPDVGSLLENSSSVARRYYAISIPDDGRFVTRILRLFLPLQGVVLRRGTFRFFIPSRRMVTQSLAAMGFRQVEESKVGRTWSVLLFASPGSEQ